MPLLTRSLTRLSTRLSTRLRAAGLAAALALSVAACSSLPAEAPRPPILEGTSRGDILHLSGRFSMNDTTRVPEERHSSASGLYRVERSADGLLIELSSPLGQTLVRATQRPGQPAELVTQNGDRLSGDSLDEVFYRAIGIEVPASRLPDWLEGRFEQVLSRNPDGSQIRATEAGWQIDRRHNRWDITRDEGSRRIEVRLIADVD